jgi:2-polyprenyl-6-hydroxyphenyl methylase/3-demethylubiquinone-9 3-methyltransferase
MLNENIFDQLSDQWWDKQGTMKGLHAMNKPRLDYIKSHIDLPGAKVLDVGCGGGILTEALAISKASVTGIDISASLINCAKEHAKKQKLDISYLKMAIQQMEDKFINYFELITCMELLEHVDNPKQILHHCYRLLRNDGIIVISTLNRTIQSYLLGIIAAEYILNIVPKGTHNHQKFIKPAEMTKLLKQHGFTTICIKGVGYNPITNNSFITTDISVNYILAARKISD